MRSPTSLRAWTRRLLPGRTPCAQAAALELLRSLLIRFTVNRTQLARQCDRETPTRGARQFLSRWFQHPQWGPDCVYAALPHLVPALWRQRQIPLLLDYTYVGYGGTGWAIFQVSLPWQRRALPVYRVVTSRTAPEWGQTQVVLAACGWLAQILPGPRSRYVLVMDRGFPSLQLITALQALGWRFVLRVGDGWTLTHPAHQGRLRTVRATTVPQSYPDAVLGWCRQGRPVRGRSCRVHVVAYRGPGYQEPWYLATTERDPQGAVSIYRTRMQIEAEFRDLKGPWGLDALAAWHDREAVARFLAWVAVYEWRLAHLWHVHNLADQRRAFQGYGALSWLHLTQEWLARRLRPPKELACSRL